MFIGREKELAFLEDRYQDKSGQLIVLYGRRRIGKTETLKKFCEGKPHVFFSCRECTDKLQLKSFSERLLKEDIPAKQYMNEFQNWETAFQSILDLPYGSSKKLIVIDEFPYMCRGNGSIPSILQNLWDDRFQNENVMIILCGSAMSFIEKELLAEKNPLYGRATGIYKMQEMSFDDAVRFFPDYSREDKVRVYSILGGIPHYLKQFDPALSLEENIKKYILTKGSVLYSEVEFLLRQELRETNVYNSIVQAVALGNTKLNDISQKALVEDNPKTSVYLKSLMELGIIKKEFSVDASPREAANKNRGVYRIADSFFRFWYAFAFTNLSALETDDVDGVFEYSIKPNLDQFASFAFEDICRGFVVKLQKENKLPFRYNKIGKWFGKTTVRRKDKTEIAETEIDLLAVSEQEKKWLVGECKFKSAPFSYSEFLDLEAKLKAEKEKNEFTYILFSKSGFDERIRTQTVTESPVILYDLEDIV